MKPKLSLHVSHVRANLKGGVNAQLSQRVLVLGPNASRKSALALSLKLPLNLCDEDIGKTGAALMTLATHGDGTLRAVAELKNASGEVIGERDLFVKGSVSRASVPVCQFKALPGTSTTGEETRAEVVTDTVRALLSKRADLQRRTILNLVAPPDLLNRVRSELPESQLSVFEEARVAVEAASPATKKKGKANGDDEDVLSEAELLVAITEYLEGTRKNLKVRKGLDSVQRPVAPTEQEITALEARRKSAVEAAAQHKAREQSKLYVARVTELDLPAARTALERLTAQSRQESDAPTFTREKLDLAAGVINHASALILLMDTAFVADEGRETAKCLCCGRPATLAEVNTARAALVTMHMKVQAGRAQLAAFAGTNLGAQQAQAQRKVDDLESDLRAAREALSGEPAGHVEDVEVLGEAIRSANAAVEAQKTYDSERNENARAMAKREVFSAILKTLNRLIAEQINSHVARFEVAVSLGLPQGAKLAVRPFGAVSAVGPIGVEIGGHVTSWRALSGAQRSQLFVALAAAVAQQSSAAIRLVLVDDVALDAVSLAALAASVDLALKQEGGITQACITALSAPEELIKSLRWTGWTVIHTAELERATLNEPASVSSSPESESESEPAVDL